MFEEHFFPLRHVHHLKVASVCPFVQDFSSSKESVTVSAILKIHSKIIDPLLYYIENNHSYISFTSLIGMFYNNVPRTFFLVKASLLLGGSKCPFVQDFSSPIEPVTAFGILKIH